MLDNTHNAIANLPVVATLRDTVAEAVKAELQAEIDARAAEAKRVEDIRANHRNHAEIYLMPFTLIGTMVFPMIFAMIGIPLMFATPTIFLPQMTFTMIKTLRKW
jgi:hypothetical protein